jgi:hypothetical protein
VIAVPRILHGQNITDDAPSLDARFAAARAYGKVTALILLHDRRDRATPGTRHHSRSSTAGDRAPPA